MATKTKTYHISDLTHNRSIDEIAQAKGLPRNKYDTALPMYFTEDVFDKLGVSIWSHGLVWYYGDGSISGNPYPLTYEANLILWIYGKVTGNPGAYGKYAIDPKEWEYE